MEREIERLRRDNEKLRRELTDSEKRMADQSKQIADLGKKNADLERKLGLKLQNSTTSSKPPSSDGLAGKQRPRCVSQRKKSDGSPAGSRGMPAIIATCFHRRG